MTDSIGKANSRSINRLKKKFAKTAKRITLNGQEMTLLAEKRCEIAKVARIKMLMSKLVREQVRK